MHTPAGLSEGFLRVAEHEERRSFVVLAGLLVAGLLAGFLAELADAPAFGAVLQGFGIAVVAGAASGALAGVVRFHRYEASLRLHWRHWMRAADGRLRLADVARRVDERSSASPFVLALAMAAIVLLNALVFALLWLESPLASGLAQLTLAMDGLLIGALTALALLTARWCRELRLAADELLHEGAVPIWGEK